MAGYSSIFPPKSPADGIQYYPQQRLASAKLRSLPVPEGSDPRMRGEHAVTLIQDTNDDRDDSITEWGVNKSLTRPCKRLPFPRAHAPSQIASEECTTAATAQVGTASRDRLLLSNVQAMKFLTQFDGQTSPGDLPVWIIWRPGDGGAETAQGKVENYMRAKGIAPERIPKFVNCLEIQLTRSFGNAFLVSPASTSDHAYLMEFLEQHQRAVKEDGWDIRKPSAPHTFFPAHFGIQSRWKDSPYHGSKTKTPLSWTRFQFMGASFGFAASLPVALLQAMLELASPGCLDNQNNVGLINPRTVGAYNLEFEKRSARLTSPNGIRIGQFLNPNGKVYTTRCRNGMWCKECRFEGNDGWARNKEGVWMYHGCTMQGRDGLCTCGDSDRCRFPEESHRDWLNTMIIKHVSLLKTLAKLGVHVDRLGPGFAIEWKVQDTLNNAKAIKSLSQFMMDQGRLQAGIGITRITLVGQHVDDAWLSTVWRGEAEQRSSGLKDLLHYEHRAQASWLEHLQLLFCSFGHASNVDTIFQWFMVKLNDCTIKNTVSGLTWKGTEGMTAKRIRQVFTAIADKAAVFRVDNNRAGSSGPFTLDVSHIYDEPKCLTAVQVNEEISAFWFYANRARPDDYRTNEWHTYSPICQMESSTCEHSGQCCRQTLNPRGQQIPPPMLHFRHCFNAPINSIVTYCCPLRVRSEQKTGLAYIPMLVRFNQGVPPANHHCWPTYTQLEPRRGR